MSARTIVESLSGVESVIQGHLRQTQFIPHIISSPIRRTAKTATTERARREDNHTANDSRSLFAGEALVNDLGVRVQAQVLPRRSISRERAVLLLLSGDVARSGENGSSEGLHS